MPRCGKRATACAPRCRPRSSSSRRARSPSTSRRPTCRRSPAASTCRSRSASSPRPASCPRAELARYEFAGELALTGALRPIRGALPMALAARRDGRAFVLPAASAGEAALRARCASCYPAATLLAVCAHLTGARTAAAPLAPAAARRGRDPRARRPRRRARPGAREARARDRRGRRAQPADDRPAGHRQVDARAAPARAPAAACARTRRSRSRRSRRSPGASRPAAWGARPFRAPHHTASAVALVGGGSDPRPGEISLAHHGVLFLDELPEWDRRVLEVLREPLEVRRDPHLARRAAEHVSRREFQLVAAMNPCPCGWLGHARALPLHAGPGRALPGPRSPARCSIASTSASTCRPSPPRPSSRRTVPPATRADRDQPQRPRRAPALARLRAGRAAGHGRTPALPPREVDAPLRPRRRGRARCWRRR